MLKRVCDFFTDWMFLSLLDLFFIHPGWWDKAAMKLVALGLLSEVLIRLFSLHEVEDPYNFP